MLGGLVGRVVANREQHRPSQREADGAGQGEDEAQVDFYQLPRRGLPPGVEDEIEKVALLGVVTAPAPGVTLARDSEEVAEPPDPPSAAAAPLRAAGENPPLAVLA